MLVVKSRIDLRGADVGVSQELLHSPQISTGLEQMACKGVPEHVGVNRCVKSSCLGPCFESFPNGLSAQTGPVSTNEQST
jgi:hypothetical protein